MAIFMDTIAGMDWIRKIILKEEEVIVSAHLIEDVVNTLASNAAFDGATKYLGLRIAGAEGDDLKWFYDLTNDQWELIEITSDGWRVTRNSTIFRRFKHQLPQVFPDANYPPDVMEQFMDLLNVKKENRLLLKCYFISLFIPNLAKAVLMVHGEQGTAKSMLEELIKMLVDPSVIRYAFISKNYRRVSTNDSLTIFLPIMITCRGYLSGFLICYVGAVTGSGFTKRELYTNDEDVIYSVMRAIGFNGINL